MRIAVDAMGGDFTPAVSLEAVKEALDMYPDVEILYVGHKEKLAYYMEKARMTESDRLKIVHAETVVEMGNLPPLPSAAKRTPLLPSARPSFLRGLQMELSLRGTQVRQLPLPKSVCGWSPV